MEIYRLKNGDSLIDELKKFVSRKDSGIIVGLGALENLTVKLYDLKLKKYQEKFIEGPLEIGSFTAIVAKDVQGNMDIHPHIVVCNREFRSFCGHVEKAIVGATFEFFYCKSNNAASRYFDKNIGLNLIK
jgi:hypothetical protein